MARTSLLVLIVSALALTGCVSQDKYNALKIERDQLAVQNAALESDLRAANTLAEQLRQEVARLLSGDGNALAMIDNLNHQIAAITAQRDEYQRKYEDLLRNPIAQGAALPADLANELQAFAMANSDIVEFDASRGIVKFKSDVTFELGSAELKPKAVETIRRFAQILSSPAASKYELLIAGHTDNTRVVNPQTIAKGHKDNWYLSAHRAISVLEELQKQQVAPPRMACAGYGEFRPVASNGSEAGRAQNRRVEVVILPTTIRAGSTPVARPANTGAAPRPALNKDTDNPALNK